MEKQHPIFKAIVEVSNQEDCNRAREICERYSLPLWEDIDLAFEYIEYDDPTYLKYQSDKDTNDSTRIGFYVDVLETSDGIRDVVTLEQFQELANNYNPEFNSIDDILAVFKQAIK